MTNVDYDLLGCFRSQQTQVRLDGVDIYISVYLSMVRLPDSPCLGHVRVTVSEPGPGRVLAPAGDPLLARGSQGAGALPCHQAPG